jgi:NADP-dependent 3-hydroxy acid dehydrogenase YdfG
MTASASPRLDGRVPVVAGAGNGIRRAAALAYDCTGAEIVATGRQHAELDDSARKLDRRRRAQRLLA